jgi:hypothetical protein
MTSGPVGTVAQAPKNIAKEITLIFFIAAPS